jgi:hypothetical protein
MKIRIAFAAIALFAIASAFTTAKSTKALAQKFGVNSVITSGGQTKYFVDFAHELSNETKGMNYFCDASSNICTVTSNATLRSDDGGVTKYWLSTEATIIDNDGLYSR